MCGRERVFTPLNCFSKPSISLSLFVSSPSLHPKQMFPPLYLPLALCVCVCVCVCVCQIFGCRDSAGSRAHDDITTPLFQRTSGNAQVSERKRERTARTWGKSTNELGISAPPARIGKGGGENRKRERNGGGLLSRKRVWIIKSV